MYKVVVACVLECNLSLMKRRLCSFYVGQKKSAITVDWNVSRHGGIASNSCSFYVESKVAGLHHSDRTRTRLSYKQKESIRRVKAKILRPFRCPNKHTGRTCWCDVSVSQAPGSLGHSSIVQFLSSLCHPKTTAISWFPISHVQSLWYFNPAVPSTRQSPPPICPAQPAT
jgi:hypothetical protein